MASITAHVTFSRWSVKCGQSCLVRVKWKNYEVGKQTVSAPPQSLRKIFKKFPIRQLWVVGKGAVEFTCTAFYISSMHTKQTTSKKILNLANLLSAVVSGVIFQVIGVFSWTEVNHIRMSSSWRFCSISFFLKYIQTILGANKKKVLNWEFFTRRKNSNDEFNIKFTIFSNNTKLILSSSNDEPSKITLECALTRSSFKS